jgi:hypothetical protein
LETPRRLTLGSTGPEPTGSLTQTLTWRSTGAWSLYEAISYRGLVGDASLITEDAVFGDAYARFIKHIHETPGLALFVAELSDTVTAVCGRSLTKISITIQDDPRKQSKRWERCAQGHLSEIVPQGAGPDAGAPRLVQAIQQARDETVGSRFLSEYAASVPFCTLARGEDGSSALKGPFVLTSDDAWRAFWLD